MSKKRTKAPAVEITAETHQGAEWLAQLNEPVFRDKILKELFTKMARAKKIEGFRYVHGRNEHGIDWIVKDKSALSARYVGIQAKSRRTTKQGDHQSESALRVKLQCESAYDHTFDYEGTTIRSDAVDLWTSAHITEDAQQEIQAPLARKKIGVKRSEAVFALITEYCPRITSKIPGLAVAGYLYREANPDPLSIRVLGCQLNPKRHFLEPRFSENPQVSPARAFQIRQQKAAQEKSILLEKVIRGRKHYAIIGSELSGKTYILRRLACMLAERSIIPIFCRRTPHREVERTRRLSTHNAQGELVISARDT